MAAQRPSFDRVDTDMAVSGTAPERRASSEKESLGHSSGNDARDNTILREKGNTVLGEKDAQNHDTTYDSAPPVFDPNAIDHHFGDAIVVTNAEELVTTVLHVEDDPTLNPWTFRAFFLGVGLSVFASVLGEIYYFKPQTIYVSVVFLTVIAYVLGEAMSFVIPRAGPVGRFLNPGPFNQKEHAFIVIMSSASATAAVATEILAAQDLYYDSTPEPAAAVFLVISSQLLGYGIAGLLRTVLVQPTKLLWPINIPVNTLLETLHRDKTETKVRLKVFYVVFAIMFVWEVIPEYIFPVLQGVSIFCLAHQDSLVFTTLFGGSSNNEGLGLFAVSFDWQYIASLGSPLWLPLQTMVNLTIGYFLCIVLFMAVYYGNVWGSYGLPFMSQLLYDGAQSNNTYFVPYNLTNILTSAKEIDTAALNEIGIPRLTGTYVAYLVTTNMGITCSIVHMLLWNYDDIKAGWYFLTWENLRKLGRPAAWMFWKNQPTKEERKAIALADPKIDPHYKIMMQNEYEEVPNWWFGGVLVISFAIGLGTLYGIGSTLPWWGYIISNLIAALFILFFGLQYGITGFQFNQQPIVQMLAGYIHPGKPLANMYFTVFGFNGVQQGQLLLRDLKLAQFAHLSPKSTFTAQMIGAVIGAIFNYIMMKSIVSQQRDTLLALQGTNIWSGQNVQQYNTLAIAWSIANDMFSVGARYEWVTLAYLIGFIVPVPFWLIYRYTKIEFFRYLNFGIILWYMGWLFVGINSSILSYLVAGYGAQFYLRRYHPALFVKYNYIVSAALDGGTQVIVFILSFAVFGASGKEVDFPLWAGNNGGTGNNYNTDYCMFNPANA